MLLYKLIVILNLSCVRGKGERFTSTEKANNKKIQEDLHQFSQKFVREQDQNPGVEENWANFKDAIFQTLKENVPQKELKEKPGLPWITSKIQRLMKHRRKAYDKARKS